MLVENQKWATLKDRDGYRALVLNEPRGDFFFLNTGLPISSDTNGSVNSTLESKDSI